MLRGHGPLLPAPPARFPQPPAAGCPRETRSLPEAGRVGAAKRQGCREMKSELPQLGLQGPLSFPINNSGFSQGREDDIISHPVPITTLPFASLFLVIFLHLKLHAVKELGTPWHYIV